MKFIKVISEESNTPKISKGFTLDFNEDGFVKEINIVGLERIPSAYFRALDGSKKNVFSKENIKVIIDETTKTIESMAFYSFNYLSELHILGDVDEFQSQSLQGTGLSKLVMSNITKVPTIPDKYVIDITPIASGTGFIYVPDELVESFKVANGWSDYSNQIKGVSEL